MICEIAGGIAAAVKQDDVTEYMCIFLTVYLSIYLPFVAITMHGNRFSFLINKIHTESRNSTITHLATRIFG